MSFKIDLELPFYSSFFFHLILGKVLVEENSSFGNDIKYDKGQLDNIFISFYVISWGIYITI